MNKGVKSYISFDGTWLGDAVFSPQLFKESIYAALNDRTLKNKGSFEQHRFVGNLLLEEIKAAKDGTYILPAVIDFIGAVRRTLLPTYHFASFEIFLDNYAKLEPKEDLFLRGKIVGRYIPRTQYQAFFPVGTGKSFNGSHFSVAHFSPDIDTVIASFHGFLDAFATKVGKGIHYWQVPNGPPVGSIEIDNLFYKPFGKDVFDVLVKTSRELTLTSLDLVSQEHIIIKNLSESSIGVNHDRVKNSVIVIDENGGYIADWRAVDYDEVRMIINNFQLTLRSFEQTLYMAIVKFLIKKGDLKNEIANLLKRSFFDYFHIALHHSSCMDKLNLFIVEVLGFKKGLNESIGNFLESTDKLKPLNSSLHDLAESLNIENSLQLYHNQLADYFAYLDSLEIAIAVKRKVLQLKPVTVSHLDDYHTITAKMEGYSHLTVVHEDKSGLTPLGVIHAKDIKGQSLATVSMRDFSNSDEMDKPSFMDIVSCIDHHKSDLKTNVPSLLLVSDAQSTNSTVAKINMSINDQYSSHGYTKKDVEPQIKQVSANLSLPGNVRILKRLLSIKEVLDKNTIYFIAKDKEFLDYMHFLFAILDDTDLLTKVTAMDVYVVAGLMNRMKSLMLSKEVEIVDFDDLDPDASDFAEQAAKKLLQSHDLYSLYSDNYAKKEQRVEDVLKKAIGIEEASFFQDTKVIGKYAEIGQYKLFSSNHTTFHKKKSEIQKHWLERCKEHASDNPSLSIFIFMISTVDSAEDLFSGAKEVHSTLKDEIWITFVQGNRESLERTNCFIKNLMQSPKVYPQQVDLVLHGDLSNLEEAVKRNSSRVQVKIAKAAKVPFAELYVDIKSLKSRKIDIAPYI